MPLGTVRLLTPVPWPNKVVAYPVNYHEHGVEMGSSYRANNQGFFLKPPSALSGPADPIVLPVNAGRRIDHECELAVIIGKQGRDIPRAAWREHVFGYSCLIDAVIRGKEERVTRKGFDTFCPVGPWIVTEDEIGDAVHSLQGRLWVNGELRQDANTRDLVLDIPGMIEMASSVMTLYPGDIIATGTPAGVGPMQPWRQGSKSSSNALARWNWMSCRARPERIQFSHSLPKSEAAGGAQEFISASADRR